MAKKGEKAGPRVTVSWGTSTKKVKGKKVTNVVTSQVLESTAKLFGLKTVTKSTSATAVTKSIKTTKGKRLILSGGVKKVGTKKMFASVDGKVFHQLPIPMGLSLAKAYSIFQGGKKAYVIKFQGGTPRIIGKKGKDTKSKSKAAAAAAK